MQQSQVLGLALQTSAAIWQVCLLTRRLDVMCMHMTWLACHVAWLPCHMTWVLSPLSLWTELQQFASRRHYLHLSGCVQNSLVVLSK